MTEATLEAKLNDLPKKLSEWCDIIIRDNANMIISMNKEQLKAGQGVDDNPILASGSGGAYRPFTVKQRKKKNLQTAVVDLKVTGDLWGHIKIKKESDNIWNMFNDDPELKEKMKFVTKENWGLNTENEEKLIDIMTDELEQYLRGYFA
jgi:hypothetical protein